MKILVLGAGATGGYFGGRLHQAGADVTFLVRTKRAQQLATQGLVIESTKDKVALPVKTVLAEAVKPDYDIVILACKAFDVGSSIAAITPAMGSATCVLPLLNGISHLDTLDAAFGKNRVMGGACQIAATLTKDGVVKSLTAAQSIVWGTRDAAQAELAHKLADAFANTVVDWKVSSNIMLDMWEKVTFLCTLAGMTCLMRASVGDILAAPDGHSLIQRCFDSCVAIATQEGFAPRPNVIERFQAVLSAKGSMLTASMLRDIENNLPVEANHVVGFMLSKARRHGIDDLMLQLAYTHLKAYEARRARQVAS